MASSQTVDFVRLEAEPLDQQSMSRVWLMAMALLTPPEYNSGSKSPGMQTPWMICFTWAYVPDGDRAVKFRRRYVGASTKWDAKTLAHALCKDLYEMFPARYDARVFPRVRIVRLWSGRSRRTRGRPDLAQRNATTEQEDTTKGV
jgi:hypothetical protein